ncbi:tyrosine-type recombinase/integrase [Marinoscillum sp.]|uniref:site-specific integrase n=1 Tax=Marinoscillum sp. TaxID=2024838 RepID=UPI003BA8BFB8
MINLSFYINSQKISQSGYAPIYMLITFNGQRIRKAVKQVRVKPGHWNTAKEVVKRSGSSEDYNGHEEFNERLENIRESVHKINRHILKFGSKLSKEFILKRIDNPNLIEVDRKSFFQTFDEFIEVSKSYKKERTIKGIQTVRSLLETYQNDKLITIDFEEIDQEFFELLRSYSFQEKKWSINYFKKIIQVLKAFMQWSSDRGYHSNVNYKKFKAKESEKEIIYLTMEEFQILFDYPFESKRLSHVRDIYCFACSTGLRFSDVINLKPSEVYKDHILKRIHKTNEVNVTIPLNRFSKQILNKYKQTIWDPLPKISAQKFNNYIKECCQEVGINKPITVYNDSGGVRTQETKPKYELITSHTARKTFVTNSLILGMHETVVKEITGHKKQESFRRYVKVADSYRKSEMAKAWG